MMWGTVLWSVNWFMLCTLKNFEVFILLNWGCTTINSIRLNTFLALCCFHVATAIQTHFHIREMKLPHLPASQGASFLHSFLWRFLLDKPSGLIKYTFFTIIFLPRQWVFCFCSPTTPISDYVLCKSHSLVHRLYLSFKNNSTLHFSVLHHSLHECSVCVNLTPLNDFSVYVSWQTSFGIFFLQSLVHPTICTGISWH